MWVPRRRTGNRRYGCEYQGDEEPGRVQCTSSTTMVAQGDSSGVGSRLAADVLHRSLRYQRAALPAGQPSITPAVW
jgi:hypothetical protein